MPAFRSLTTAAMATGIVGGASEFAASVTPGETINDPSDDTPTPVGELIDEDVREVTFQLVAPEGYGFQNVSTSADITFTSGVYRDPATQRLSFVYSWDFDIDSFLPEGGTMSVRSFTNFTTDVTGDLKPDGTINRSADGSTITGTAAQGLGVGPVRTLIVATNATEYDQGGNLQAEGLDFLGLVNLETQEIEDQFVSAQVSLAGTFQPITDSVNPVIPLPAGVWGGMIMLGGAAGVARRLRRR